MQQKHGGKPSFKSKHDVKNETNPKSISKSIQV